MEKNCPYTKFMSLFKSKDTNDKVSVDTETGMKGDPLVSPLSKCPFAKKEMRFSRDSETAKPIELKTFSKEAKDEIKEAEKENKDSDSDDDAQTGGCPVMNKSCLIT